MSIATLPPNITNKLEVFGRRLHRLRLLRGWSWVALVFVLGAATALSLDATFDLPPYVRCFLTGAWIAGVATTAWRELIRPLRRRVTTPGLAAAVEEEYPDFGERLTSAVELAGADNIHGSPLFVNMLMRETDRTSRSLDFRRAAPPHATEWLTAVSIAAVLAFAAPLVLFPDYYIGLGRRLLMPWDRRPAVMPFAMDFTPGDAFAARGRPLTIAVEFRPTHEKSALPNACTLVMTGEDQKQVRLKMPAGGTANSFAFRIDELKSNVRYHIEAGQIESEGHAVIAVDPVELAGGPTTVLSPPPYAKSVAIQTIEGPNDLAILQFGQVAIDCRFDRPAESATLIVTPISGSDLTPQRRPLSLADDHRSGHIAWPAQSAAKLRLELAAEHGIVTLTPEQILTVTPDRPPEFRRAAGFPESGAVRPNDALSLDLNVADDIAVATVEVEFRVNDGPIQREPIAIAGIGSPEAAGHAEFKLTKKVKDGDKLMVRLRAADNRNVPDAKLGPNVVTFPVGDHWTELRVSADAPSVRQQDVTAKRDDIDKRLRELIGQIDRVARRTYALHQNIDRGRSSADEQTQGVHDLTSEQADLSKKLEELSGDAAVAGLKPLADAMRAVGEQEFRQSAEGFRDAGTTVDKNRIPPLRRADAALTDARKKLEALLQENRDLADARLAEVILNELAEREKELADQAKQEASPEDREKLAKEQEQIAEELKKITENDEKLRDAVQAAQADETGKLAEQARKLAQAERDLDAKLAEAERQRNVAKLADLAKQQQKLAAEADKFAKQTKSAARTTQTPPLDARPAAKAADDLRSGDADNAQQRQDQSARELDRIAEKLQKGIETAKDPREAAQQLAKLQEDNRVRLDRPAEKSLARQEQESIRNAVENLKLPEENAAARRDRQQAAELAAEAARSLNRDDPANAEFRMSQAIEALDRLAKDLPTAEDRRRRARDEVAKLREAQEEIGRQTDKAAKSADKGNTQAAADERAEAARKQADIADRLSKLDAPGQDDRRDRAIKAAARAEDDLQNPHSADVPASQADARRTLERLAEALAGKTPADEKARELARQERDLANAAAKVTGNPSAQANLQRRQEKVAQDTQSLKPTEALVRQGEATQATIQANAALRDKPNEADTLQKMRTAADKLDALADQLAGCESAAEQADRLAKSQEAAAKQPTANPIEARRQANQIAGEMQQLRAGPQAAQAKQAAADALQRLQRTPPSNPENARALQDAAQALRRLSDELNREAAAKDPAPRPEELARQQRELARETDSARQQSDANQQLRRLSDRQEQLRRQADRLPTERAPKAVQQARQAMQQAEQALAKQDGNQAAQRQQQAADALDKAARQMARSAPATPPNQPLPDGMPTPAQVGQARDLAQRQRDLRDQVAKATAGDSASGEEHAAANRQQQDLARQAGNVARSLDEAAGTMSAEQARQSARGAAASARQGEQSLQQAQGNDRGQTKQARRQAADSLDQAAGQAERAARAGQQGQPQPGAPEAGQQLQNAQSQMKQAGNQLGQGQGQQAGGSMQKAADSLQEAANQVGQQGGQQGPPRQGASQPAIAASQGKGTPTAGDLPKEFQKYAGKKWGELPGELRTRIVQDMKAQYGDDYGRVIKLYFEQIADNSGKK